MAQTDITMNNGGGSANAFSQASWANCRSGTGGTVSYSDDSFTLRSDLSGPFIQRCFFNFDTSTLPDDATVTAAELRLYRNDSVEGFVNTNTITMHVVLQNQSDPTELGTAGDYQTTDFNSKGSLLQGSTSNGAYFAITLSDLENIINLTGYTKLALITDRDLNNSAPTGNNRLGIDPSTNPPILRVTYTVPGGEGNVMFFSGGGLSLG